jgi:ABC-type dipeptide/oligopeptide/nickel transport system permease subunit
MSGGKVMSPGQMVLRRFLRHKMALTGTVTLIVIALACVIGPFIAPMGEYEQFFDIQKAFGAEQLKELIDEGIIPDSAKVHIVRYESNGIKSRIMKNVREVPSKEIYPVMDAVNGGIPEELDPDKVYRLNNISFTDAETKYIVSRGWADYTMIGLFAKTHPSPEHWLGTDRDGFDVFTRMLYGGRVSLLIGIICVVIEMALGMTLGGVSGYFGGWADAAVMRVVDIFNAVPLMPIIILANSAMRAFNVAPQLKLYSLMLIIGLLYWPSVARLVRGQILTLREQEFMVATKAVGLRASKRIFGHLIPNVIPQMIVYATLNVGAVIILESTLSYLGLGVSVPYSTWGLMVNAVNDTEIMLGYPLVWLAPGMAILITVMAINFLGDGLRDAFDPKMKR